MKKRNVLLGVAISAAVGTVIGMLSAPAKGSLTRKRILRKGAELNADSKEKISSYTDAVTDEYKNIKKGTKHLMKKGKSAF